MDREPRRGLGDSMSVLTLEAIRNVEDDARKQGMPEIAQYLQEALGQRLIAYIADVRDPRMVGRWARGIHSPRGTTAMRVRVAYEVTRLLDEAYDEETAKAWLLGSNSRLDGESPAYVLRNAQSPDDVRLVVPTARAFAGGTS